MRLRVDPFPLIFARGDATTRLACLEFFGLKDSPRAKDCLLKLIQQQRADGAFPSHLDPQQWGTRETVRNALLLLKVGLVADGVNVASAVEFILHHQNPDGGWSENRALTIPPEVMALSTEHSVTWITADIVELLRQVGMEARSEYRAALEWLRGMNPAVSKRLSGRP